MKREEFYRFFGKPEQHAEKFKEAEKVREFVFVKFVYDRTLTFLFQ